MLNSITLLKPISSIEDAQVEEVKEPLFDDLEGEVPVDPKDSADIAGMLYGIKQMESKIATYTQQANEATAFYDKRKNALVERIKFLKGRMEGYLEGNAIKSLATHNGTIMMVERLEKHWPSTAALTAFAMEKHTTDPTLVRTYHEPSIANIEKYMAKTGEVAPGYSEEKTRKFQIRK